MTEPVVIARRFNGPPESAHGGYACAVVAQHFGWAAEVTLRAPPPIERPLSVRRDGVAASLWDGETLVAEGRPGTVDLDPPRGVTLAEAEAAARASPWLERHPFPTCFGCGPERPVGDGMREFPGPVASRPGVVATPWVPDGSLADDSGDIDPLFVFAALDCPSGAGAIDAQGADLAAQVHVLARLTGQVFKPVTPGEPQIVVAWGIRVEGRKRTGGVAILNGDEVVAQGKALWIALEDPASFRAASAG